MPEARRVVRRKPRWTCPCGETSVETGTEQIIVRGKGWRKEYQFIVCGGCNQFMRYSPDVVWEAGSGERYTTRQYLKGEG